VNSKILSIAFLVVLMVVGLSLPTNAQTSTPPSLATIATATLNVAVDVPRSELYSSMATAAAQVNSLPNDIRQQNGVNIIPNTNNATQLFGYAKWLFSYNTARELLGNTFAPIGMNLFILLVIVVVIATIYLIVNFVVLLIRFVLWLIRLILQFIPFLG
jgi:hypothetical protein